MNWRSLISKTGDRSFLGILRSSILEARVKKFVYLCLLFGLSACSKPSTTATVSQPQAAPQVESSKPPPSPTFRSKAPTDKLVPKHQPILGDEREQLDFKVKDAQAILDGKPRPQSPITLAVLAGNPPSDIDVCNLPFAAVTKLMFENCAEEGMNYIKTANTFGFAGELTTQTGDSKTYTWSNGSGGVIAITFIDDKLTSKTQSGLK